MNKYDYRLDAARLEEDTRKNEMLRELLPTVVEILQDYFIDDAQFDRITDFVAEIAVIGDAEIAHQKKMLQVMKNVNEVGKRR
jgi:hypothetical protein